MGKTILLADDSVTIHKVVELTFLDEDYTVEAVSSGDEAIARLAEGPPDLVIADIHMPPGPNGYEVCDRVREQHPGVPVLLLSGAFEPFDEERARAADAYLKKPFDSQKLLQKVQELMARGAGAADPGSDAAAEPGAAAEGHAGAAGPASVMAARGAEGRPAAAAAAPPQAPAAGNGAQLSPEAVDAIARRVVELIGDQVLREVAWEVLPDLAEVVVKDRLRELEEQGD